MTNKNTSDKNTDQKITAFITKYALTIGILEKQVTHFHGTPNMIRDHEQHASCYHGEGKEWHRTKEGAINRAEEMKLKKIASLKLGIAKLEKMTFADF